MTVHPDGHVSVAVGTTSHGQGHETVYARLAAAELTIAVRTLKDYTMPTARDVPRVRIVHQSTPSDLPGGFRGAGESAAILTPAMIGSAVHDALRPRGVAVRQTDLRPAAVRGMLRAGGVAFDVEAAVRGALRGASVPG